MSRRDVLFEKKSGDNELVLGNATLQSHTFTTNELCKQAHVVTETEGQNGSVLASEIFAIPS